MSDEFWLIAGRDDEQAKAKLKKEQGGVVFMNKSITAHYNDFLSELNEDHKSGKSSPLSRSEVLILQMFVDFVNKKEAEITSDNPA